MPKPNSGRSPMAVAMQWVSEITTISLMMVLPSLAGYWVDHRFQCQPLGILGGAALGMVLGTSQLMRLVRILNQQNPRQSAAHHFKSSASGSSGDSSTPGPTGKPESGLRSEELNNSNEDHSSEPPEDPPVHD